MGLTQDAIASITQIYQQSASLLLYQSVLETEAGIAFHQLLQTILSIVSTPKHAPGNAPTNSAHTLAQLQADIRKQYGRWFTALANQNQSWRSHLVHQILLADNAFSQAAQRCPLNADLAMHSPGALLTAAQHDLQILRGLAQISGEQVSQWVQDLTNQPSLPAPMLPDDLPDVFAETDDWAQLPQRLAKIYREQGVGLWGQFCAFRWEDFDGNGQLAGIANPDSIKLQQLFAYDHPKQQLIQNTEALIAGYTAQNVLLYGSRGAGKSSLVKALLTEYCDRGLRLIEVPKRALHQLPQILPPLRQQPQKFIIFVDDLSFEEDDEAFKALKVVLEGGITARPQNVVVYATSNRRHLVREYFEERPRPKDADEIQSWDTVQEKLSFSDRFGLTLTFTPADQLTYLTIVRQLAAQAGLDLEPENLDWRARQWATRHNGRSGRSARQFVDYLIAEKGIKDQKDQD